MQSYGPSAGPHSRPGVLPRICDAFVALVLAGMLLLLVAYTYWKAHNGIGDTDTAFFLDVLQNTWHTGLPTTSAVRAFLNVYQLIEMDAAQFCAIDMAQVLSHEPANILLGHATLVVYPLSAVAQLIGPELTAAIATALAFVGLPAVAYVFLRRQGVSALLCLLFVAVLCLHPAWRIATEGWIYFDRLFMPFGLAFALMLHQAFSRRLPLSGARMLTIALLALAGALIHERGALLLLMVAIAHLVLYRKVPRSTVALVAAVALALVLYLVVYASYQRNVDNAEVYKNFFILKKFLENVFRPGLPKLFFFNLVFIALAFVFSWRAALIALAAIFPNVIVSIGGAEKDGWITHYHSFYFPFVIFAGAAGLAAAHAWFARRQVSGRTGGRAVLGLALVLLASGLCMAFMNPYGPSLDWKSSYVKEGLARPVTDLYLVDPKFSSNAYEVARADRLVAAIAPGASVSYMTPFNTWKLFANRNTIQLFPIGTGSSDYLLLTFAKDASGKVLFETVGAALDPREHEKAKQCATEKVWQAGYKQVLEINHFMLLRR